MTTYPLTQSQMSVFMGWQTHPTTTAWNLPSMMAFPKSVDADRLAAALEAVVAARPELRIKMTKDQQGRIRQYVDETMAVPVVVRRMSDAAADEYMDNGFVRPFQPLGNEPLCRLELVSTPTRHIVLLDIHHTIADGTTIAYHFIRHDLPTAYAGKALPQPPAIPPLFVEALQEAADTDSYRYCQSKAHLLNKFRDITFTRVSREATNTWGKERTAQEILPRREVDGWCAHHGHTPQTLFLAAFSVVLSKLSRQRQVACFVLNHGRTNRLQKEAYGMFVRSLPVLINTDDAAPISQLLNTCHRELLSSYRHSIYPSTHFCRDAQVTPAITFGFQGEDIQEDMTTRGMKGTGRQLSHGEVCHDLNCTIYVSRAHYEIRMDSSETLNSRATISMAAQAVKTCVQQLTDHLEVPLKDVAIVAPEEEQRILTLGRGRETDTSHEDTTWVALFEQQAEATPDATALVCHDGTLTYRELDNRATAYARRLNEKDKDGTCCPFLPVTAHRGKEFIVAVIGTMKAGFAYVPIDAEWPEERRQQTLKDLQAAKAPQRQVNDDNGHDNTDNRQTGTRQLAYMIYTSGSTGTPKGVMVTHQGLVNLTRFIVREWQLTANSRISCHAPFTFDASVEDIFPVLTVGGTLYVVPDVIRMNLTALAHYLKANDITGGCYTTPLGVMLAQQHHLTVDYLCVGGERLAVNPFNMIPKEQYAPRLINTYGPTECTVNATYYTVDRQRESDNIPIGRPVDNLQLLVTDHHGQLLPQGATGELWIGGPQVAAGYWNEPVLTQERFTPCRWCQGKVYHTGDLVRWNEEGVLEFVGRTDRQVKRHGYRIEPAEIERHLLLIDGIKQAVVTTLTEQASDYPDNELRLCAYYTAEKNSGQDTSEDTIRRLLQKRLPAYLMPDTLTRLKEMPLTAHGKTDTTRLPAPRATPREYVAPDNKKERQLCEAFAKTLKTKKIGAKDNFFDCGGTSMMVMLLLGEAERLGLRLTYRDVFEHPTPRELAGITDLTHLPENSFPADRKVADAHLETHSCQKTEEHGKTTSKSTTKPVTKKAKNFYSNKSVTNSFPADNNENNQAKIESPASKLKNRILLTGATGFLGSHILQELARQGIVEVWCLVRDKDGISAEKRLHGKGIHIISGDICSASSMQQVRQYLTSHHCPVNTIIHCAADIRHFAPGKEMERTNVGGTEQVIRLCQDIHARLIHISTISLDTDHRISALPYLLSKQEAEERVAEAVRKGGLQADILRVGNLIPSTDNSGKTSHTGKNGPHNAFTQFLQLLQGMGACPECLADYPVDLSPVDLVAQEIVRRALDYGEPLFRYHHKVNTTEDRIPTQVGQDARANVNIVTISIAPPRPIRQLVEELNRQGSVVNIVSDREFLQKLQKEKDHSYAARMLYEELSR